MALLPIVIFGAACSPPLTATIPSPKSPSPSPPPRFQAAAEVDRPLERAGAQHLLNRFTFGATRADLEATETTSARAWMQRQLEPQAIDDTAASSALDRYRNVLLPPRDARETYLHPVRRKSATGIVEKLSLESWRLIQDAQMVQFVRQAEGNRQLLEVMVDFWINHFNVYALKDAVVVLMTDYIERAIRPHALGRFDELLIATARHPAMLVYLDNHVSTATQSNGKKRASSGITENYARELLELHTLGVHGGYSQQDVIEVARILTGWTVKDLRAKEYEFAFKPEMHDNGTKIVLGVKYPPNGGQQEGLDLLRQLAAHPATARHLAIKLCARFVDDNPPPSCIERLEQTYTITHGHIGELLQAIVTSPEFWQHRRSKFKSPNLYLVSACRALGVLPRGAAEHAKLSSALGEPKLMQPAPTGYVEDAAAWTATAGMLERMNFALGLAWIATQNVKAPRDNARVVDHVNQLLFGGFGSPATLGVLRNHVAEARPPEKLRTAIALALASPDFQYY